MRTSFCGSMLSEAERTCEYPDTVRFTATGISGAAFIGRYMDDVRIRNVDGGGAGRC